MKKLGLSILSLVMLFSFSTEAATVLSASWDDVVAGKCSDQNTAWWSSSEAVRIAENVLLYQKDCGGWPKNIEMQLILSQTEKNNLTATQSVNAGATIDNNAVKLELKYLSRVYAAISNATFKAEIKAAFLNGIQYLLDAQYTNGGWPQFYPLKGGYANHITYNDNAMLNAMNVLRHIYQKDSEYSILATEPMLSEAETAFNKGVQCILNTQYKQDGILTAWCAQHHYSTLEPVLARSYELPSISGYESKAIAEMLMSLDNPSYDVRKAIYCAAAWYDRSRIVGQRLEAFVNTDGLNDKRLINDPAAPDMWARFYNLDTNIPFFCDRDGIPKATIAEIGYERRNGYSWYTNAGLTVISGYETWFPNEGDATERDGILASNTDISSTSKTIQIYPNPAKETFSIDLQGIGFAKIQIYSLSGTLVYTDYATSSIHSITNHKLSAGTYILKVTAANQISFSQKLIIQ